MRLDVLPTRHGGAAENMAVDFLLLQRYPDETRARFRHYGWQRPAFTFGYSQKIAFVREQLPAGETVELCRRPTGGGVVDHRNDWTYALVIPRAHSLYETRASASYQIVHDSIARSLRDLGERAVLKESCEPKTEGEPCGPTVCFTRAELHDVVHADSEAKIAGAAQKRTKHGLLFQGSINRSAVSAVLDWERLGELLIQTLASNLDVDASPTAWPEFNEDEVSALVENYSSHEWKEFR